MTYLTGRRNARDTTRLGNGDYVFHWQPHRNIWYFLSVGYSVATSKRYPSQGAPNGLITLHVDSEFVEDSTMKSGVREHCQIRPGVTKSYSRRI
jgi:hypothetical protein